MSEVTWIDASTETPEPGRRVAVWTVDRLAFGKNDGYFAAGWHVDGDYWHVENDPLAVVSHWAEVAGPEGA